MSDTLTLTKREALGTRASQRLRADGQLPVVLYGHKEAVEHLTAPAADVRKAVAHHAQMVNLTGDASGQAMVQDVQWDTFHRELLHLDLLRVDAKETVETDVVVVLKGDAVGVKEGGVIEQQLDTLKIAGPASDLPEELVVDISAVGIGAHVSASDVTGLPASVSLVTPGDTVIASCVPPAGEPSLDSVATSAESPEVISKGSEEAAEG